MYSTSLSVTRTNARNTYFMCTTLRLRGILDGKLTNGHLIAKRKEYPTPLFGEKTLWNGDPVVEFLSFPVEALIAGSLPFGGVESYKIIWTEKSCISVASPVPDENFVTPSNVIPTLDMSAGCVS